MENPKTAAKPSVADLDTQERHHIQSVLLESALVVLKQHPHGLDQLHGLLLIGLDQENSPWARHIISEALIELEAYMAGIELIYPPNA